VSSITRARTSAVAPATERAPSSIGSGMLTIPSTRRISASFAGENRAYEAAKLTSEGAASRPSVADGEERPVIVHR
jgi:hypothetical protein